MGTTEVIDVAARHFVYKLDEAKEGQPGQMARPSWDGCSLEHRMWAVERGWVMLQGKCRRGR